jgi:lipase ATG15
MRVSLFLQNIFTSSFLLKRPYTSLQHHQGPIFELDVPNHINENIDYKFTSIYDLPINYNTIKNMMLMSYDAYMDTNDSKWDKVDYNLTGDISVSPNDIKGYLFSDETKTHNIVAIKGTSISFIPMFLNMFNSTVTNDKFNDNLFFSCCYYKESKLFNNYCTDDSTSKYDCKRSCYENSTSIDKNYITMLPIIMDNIKKVIDFDNSNVYFTGHSLGSFLANIMGMKYNKQVIGFDSPGTRHYIKMLNLTGNTNRIYNFGHTADSIMHGDCQSVCKTWGYNLDTECHIGNTCIYDSKKKLGYFDGIRYHQLKWIIDYILPHWENDFPECVFDKPCKERNCDKWDYN